MWYTIKSRKGSKSTSFKCGNCGHSFPVTTADGSATYWKNNGIEQSGFCPHCNFNGKPVEPKPQYESMDISSGFGIGGHGSDDHDMRFETDVFPSHSGKCSWGGTRYDEECVICHRVTSICNNCERCERCHGE